MRKTFTIALVSVSGVAWSQDQVDSIQTRRLEEVVIKAQQEINVERLPDITGTRIWSGKKNEVLNVTNLDANIAE
jgi:Fe(3+) dicitrate transport protein